MYANDQQGLLMEISRIFTEGNVDVKSMNVRTSKKGTATIEMGFIVHGREELERIVKKLQQLSGIIDIERAKGEKYEDRKIRSGNDRYQLLSGDQ